MNFDNRHFAVIVMLVVMLAIVGVISSSGVSDHGALTGLTDDDHTQYALLDGRSGGQTLIGGTATGQDITLQSNTSDDGSIFFSGYDCSGLGNDGALTATSTGEIICSTDDGGAGGSGDSVLINGSGVADVDFLDGDIDFTLNAGPSPDEVTATVACTGCIDSTDLDTDYISEAELSDEAELQAQLTDVTDVFTNNDGALADDDLSDDNLTSLADVDLTGDVATSILVRNAGDTEYNDQVLSGDATMTAGGVVTVGDITCTDCINATEIEDIYVLVAGDNMTGDLDIDTELDVVGHSAFGDAAGVSAATALLVNEKFTDTSGNVITGSFVNQAEAASASTATHIGVQGIARADTTDAPTSVQGIVGTGNVAANAVLTNLLGVKGNVYFSNGLTSASSTSIIALTSAVDVEDSQTTNALAFSASMPNLDTGTITNAYGLNVWSGTNTAGTIGTAYGVHIGVMDYATTNYSFYAEDGDFIIDEDGDGVAGASGGGGEIWLGEGQDAAIYWSGSQFVLTASGSAYVLGGLDCTGNSNGGALTADATGLISCTDDDGGGGSGDVMTVNSTAIDTTGNFLDGDIDFTHVDGGGGGPDDITATVACSDCVDLGTETAGNYVDNIVGGAGVDATPAGEGATVTLTADVTEISLADDSIWQGSSGGLAVVEAVPDCDDSTGNLLNYDTATNAWTCGDFQDNTLDLTTVNTTFEDSTELVIASGAITVTQTYHRIDGEGDASDLLETIAGGTDGRLLIIRPEHDARTITVRHNQDPAGTDNILLHNNVSQTLNQEDSSMMLVYDGALDTNGAWIMLSVWSNETVMVGSQNVGASTVGPDAIGTSELDDSADSPVFGEFVRVASGATDFEYLPIIDADVPDDITIDLATSASDLTCTDCINATEIEDIYILEAGDVVTGDIDFGGGGIEIENNTAVPGSCTVGQIFMDTDATTGQQLYGCEGGTFQLQGDGGGVATIDVEEDNASVDASVTNLDFGTGFDVASSPAGEANVTFDVTEVALADDSIWQGSSGGVAAVEAIPDCNASTDDDLQYDVTTNAWFCDTTADDDSPEAGDYAAASIDGDDINHNFAGRSLTMATSTPDVIDVDVELYTSIAQFSMANYAITDDAIVQIKWPTDFTVTRISCSTDAGTTTIQFDERVETTPNTAGTDVMSSALVCDTNNQATTSFANAGIAADAPMSLDIDAITTAVIVRVHVEGTIDD